MAFLRRNSPLSVPTVVIGGPTLLGPIFTSTVITNSGVLQVGDVVAVTAAASGNGTVVRRYNAAGDKILGICVGFGQADGRLPALDAGQSPDRVTVESDNETDKLVYAKIDVSPGAVWSAPFSPAATIHTTARFGYGAQVECGTGTKAGGLTETTVSTTVSAHLGFACLGPDEQDTTRGLVVCVEGWQRGQQTAS